MDDERKKFPRKDGPSRGGRDGGKPRATSGDGPRPKPSGKPGFRPKPAGAEGQRPFDGKPRAKFGGADAGGAEKKPFRKRAEPFSGPSDRAPRRFDKPRDAPPSRPRREEPAEAAPAGERIAKRLARAGIASRRDAEELIAAGRVTVNGRVLSSPAINVLASDAIAVDGTPIPPIERTRLFLFNKPAGLVTTNRDPEGRRTVFDALPKDLPRLMTVGRLDINTEGLLLLTNDGGLARVLELPTTGWLRRYRVRVHGKVDEQALADLRDGIAVDGVFYGAIEAALDREQGSNAWLTLGLREGKNREVKNVLGKLGLDVNRLIRISYGPFQLGELAEGAVQELKGRMLRDQLGDRLIEEAGADFEAPVVNPFSNKPVIAGKEPEPQQERSFAGPPNRKREFERKREDSLGRLSTTKPARFGAKPGGKGGRRDKNEDDRPLEPLRPRSANVWMATGARPQGRKKDVAETPGEDKARQHRSRGKRETGPADRTARDLAPERKPAERASRPYNPKRRPDAGARGREERPAGDRPARKPSERRPADGGKTDQRPRGDRKPGGVDRKPDGRGGKRPGRGPGKGGGGADRRR